MKQSFLDSLKTAPVDTAVAMVKSAGYRAHLVPEGCKAITAVARGKKLKQNITVLAVMLRNV